MPSKNVFLDDAYRIMDANINRVKEGLRVCEEIARFHLNDSSLTKKFNNVRQKVTTVLKASSLDRKRLFDRRRASGDVGKNLACGPKRKSFKDIFMANAQRIKEAFRVLEEFLKLADTQASKKIQRLRFDFYELEKEAVEKFPSLLDS